MKKLSLGIQEALLALLCYDESPQGAKAVASLVSSRVFDPYFRSIAEEAESYLLQWGKPPGEHTLDIVEMLSERKPDEREIYTRIFSSLQQTRLGINREYTLQRAGYFVRRQTLKATLAKVLPLLNRDSEQAVEEAESLMVSVGKVTTDLVSAGTLFNDPSQALRFLDTMEEESMPTGIKELDDLKLGPLRKGLWIMGASMSKGKSFMAVQKGKMALVHGKKVLHITLEMSEEKVCARYCQAMFAVKRRQAAEIVASKFSRDEAGQFVGMEEMEIKGRMALDDPHIRQYLLKRLKPLATRPKLIVKQFPTGQLTLKGLNSYLDRLDATMGFTPDLCVLDYCDLMDIDSKNYRHEVDRLYKGLRGIAVERNLAMATYSQTTRSSVSSKTSGLDKLAEDIRKAATPDIVIIYNQTDAEYELGLARLLVAKARDEVKNFQVLISQAYGIGQFVLDSCKMVSSSYWPLVDKDEAEREGVEVG